MLLRELFAHHFPSLKGELKTAVLNILTPMSSHGAKSVPIQMVVDRLKSLDLGVSVNADTIRACIDPSTIPFVSDVDDKMIYLNGSSKEDDGMGMDEVPQEPADPVGDAAKKNASAEINPPRPKPSIENKF